MIALLGVECRRVRHRRLPWVVAAVLVATVVAVVTGGAVSGDRMPVDERFGEIVRALAPYSAWISAAVGASLVGAELATGGMSRVLCREPRRHRVLVAKATAAAATGAAVYITTFTGLAVALTAAATWGPFELRSPAGLASDLGLHLALGAPAAGVATAVGACASVLLGSTGAAVIGVTLLFVAAEPSVAAVWAQAEGAGPMHAVVGAMALGDSGSLVVLGATASALLATAWLVATLAGTAVVFSRRDVRDAI